VASDHGEAFRERGLEGHARFVYKETTEVPLILGFPFRLEPGVVVQTRTSNVDIWPTLLDLLGLPKLPDTDGRSRVPEILAAARGETLPDTPQTGFAHLDRHWGQRGLGPLPTVAVTDGPLRYVRVPDGAEVTEELFDSSSDAHELRNLAEERPEEVERLRVLAQQYIEKTDSPWEDRATPLEMDEMQLNQLRALGYAIP
jgi:arylsulfatase A-like enzyme